MLGDDGWRFCEAGEMLERAIITAHSVVSISRSLVRPPLATEIQLSAFLRLLSTRDAYRRVYQMRAEPIPVIEILWQHPESPRSVLHCLNCCLELLRESAAPDLSGAASALNGIESLILQIKRIDWNAYLRPGEAGPVESGAEATPGIKLPGLDDIEKLLAHLLRAHAGHP